MSDEQQKQEGKTIQFGAAQLNNPTPEKIRVIFRAILYLSAIWAIAAPQITELSPAVLATINKYLLLGNGLVNVTIKFFGWDFKN